MPDVFYLVSGGKSSVLATYYHRTKYPDNEYTYVFNDTLVEHESLYVFLVESLFFLEGLSVPTRVRYKLKKIPKLKPGLCIQERTRYLDSLFTIVCNMTGLVRLRSLDPWSCFLSLGFIGNSRVDICSRALKRDPRRWFTDQYPDAGIVLGFDWKEVHRYERALTYESNLLAPLLTDNVDVNHLWEEFTSLSGIQESEAYSLGLAHDNCGGCCVKAGQAQFKRLWETRRDVYLWHEEMMENIMKQNSSLRPFIRVTRDKVTTYLTLKEYREQVLEKNKTIDEFDFGGCGCAL